MSTLLNQSEPIPDTLNELSSLLAYINSLFVQTLNWKICQISLLGSHIFIKYCFLKNFKVHY